MGYDEFIVMYGTAWKTIFELCVWDVPLMRDWLREHWNAVFEEVATKGIEHADELWLMMAHHAAMIHMEEIMK